MAYHDGQDLPAIDSSEDDSFEVVYDNNQNEGRGNDIDGGGGEGGIEEERRDDDLPDPEANGETGGGDGEDDSDTVGDADEGGGDMEQQVGLVMPRRKEYNIYDSRRSLDPERTSDMVICRDFWLSRDGADDRFQLCPRCPPFPSPEACYRISCSKHNKE